MQLEDYFDFQTEPVETIRIKGTRMDIEHVIERYLMGIHPDRIAEDYHDVLTPDQVYATLTYFHRNRESVEAYFERGRKLFKAFIEQSKLQPESSATERMRAIKTAWASLKAEQPV